MKRIFRRQSKSLRPSKSDSPRWSSCPLESRLMLAGDAGEVIINAAGTTGEEEFELLIAGEVVGSYRAGTELTSYRYESDQAIDPGDVSVRFVNDLYKPEENFDRNLLVDNVVVAGVTYESESDDTFSTGVYLDVDGASPGFGRGDTLHTNGVFQYGGTTPTDQIELDGDIWLPIDGRDQVKTEDGRVVLGPSTEEAGIWRFVELQPGQDFTLSLSGEFVNEAANNEAQVYFGIDYFSPNGEIFANASGYYDVEESLTTKSISSTVPEGATNASVWIVLSGRGAESEFAIDSVTLETQAISDDQIPPTARLLTTEVAINSNDPFPSPPSYGLELSDNGLANEIETTTSLIVLLDPNGQRIDSPIFTGFDGDDENSRVIVLGIGPQNETPVAGTYTVELNRGALVDAAGNRSEPKTLGTFDVVVSDGPVDPDDTSPPTVEVTTATVTSDEGQFTIRAVDTQTQVGFGPGSSNKISVVDSQGQLINAFGIAGGAGETDRELFELFQLDTTDLVSGLISVFADEGYVIDGNGTPNEAGLIGTFQYLVV